MLFSSRGCTPAQRVVGYAASIALLASGIGFTSLAPATGAHAVPGSQAAPSAAARTDLALPEPSPSGEQTESPENPDSPDPLSPADPSESDSEGPQTAPPASPDTDAPTTPGPSAPTDAAPEPDSTEPGTAGTGEPPTPLSAPTPPAARAVGKNDSESRATPLELGAATSSSLTGTTDRDYFRLTAPSDGRIQFTLTFPKTLSGSTFDVRVYSEATRNSASYRLNGGDAAGRSTAVPAAFMPKGGFFVKVTPVGSNTRSVPYQLTVSHSAVAQVEREDNDSAERATFVTAGKTVSGSISGSTDQDYFVMNTAQAVDGQLKLTFPKNLAGDTYTLNLYDAKKQRITEFRLNGSHADGSYLSKQKIRFPKGQVFVKVTGSRSTLGQPYALSLGVKMTASTPTIAGKLAVGSTLTAQPGTWGPGAMKFSYQWKRNGSAISKATGASYKLTKDDAGRSITVTVTGSREGVGTASRTSAKKSIPTTFIDVPRSHQFYSEIQWMYDTKRASGTKTSKGLSYQPNQAVNRTSLAVFLYQLEAPKSYTPPKKSPFADVPTTHKQYRQITWMKQQGIITGTKSGTKLNYLPGRTVTRDELAAAVAKLRAPASYTAPKTSPFTDVAKSHPRFRQISWMRSTGLSNGTAGSNAKLFKPTSSVTRATMAAVLSRAAKLPKPAAPKPTTPATPKALTAAVPSVSGNARAGQVLSATSGAWGPAPVTLSYQWTRNGSAISGATGQSYRLTTADARSDIAVTVTGSKSGYATVSRASAAVRTSASIGDSLTPGQSLATGLMLESNNGQHRLEMQSDGNLVLRTGSTVRWESNTRGTNAVLVMQGDGNAVIYAGGKALWSTRTNGLGGHRFVVQDDSNLVLYTAQGRAIWDRVTKK